MIMICKKHSYFSTTNGICPSCLGAKGGRTR